MDETKAAVGAYAGGGRSPPERGVSAERRRKRLSGGAALGLFGLGLGAFALLVLVAPAFRRQPEGAAAEAPADVDRPDAGPPATVVAARRLNRSAGMLAFSVLADSALEHYRGSFNNPAMFVPPVVSALTIGISIHGLTDARAMVHRLRHAALCARRPHRAHRGGAPLLQRGQAPGRFLLAQLLLRRTDRRSGWHRAGGPPRLQRRAGARHPPRLRGDAVRSAGRPDSCGADQRRPSRDHGRGLAAAFSRRLPQSRHVPAGDRSAG